MIDPRDELWLKRVLEDCFESKPRNIKNNRNLDAFKTLVKNLVQNLEKRVDAAWVLWERKPDSKELGEMFYLLEKYLFYLRRFCEHHRNKREERHV